MLDIRLIRENPAGVKKNLQRRGDPEVLKRLNALVKEDSSYRKQLKELENLRHQRNQKTQELAKSKREGKKMDFSEVKKLAGEIRELEDGVLKKKHMIDSLLMGIPNLLHESVPKGEGEEQNKEVRKWGRKTKAAKGHEEIGLKLNLLDIERAAKISGARFYFLKNEAVLLDFALQKFALDFLAKKGFTLVEPPMMMRRRPYEGVVDLGDFLDVMYKAENEDLYLIATSEHPLVAQFQNETIPEEMLPLKVAGISSCFRKEAGSHGKDTKGIFRVHQFNKVEQVSFSTPEDSWKIFEELMKNTEAIYRKLELPYRIVNVCTGDIGSIAAKKLDLELWMPAQGKYREAASCSNATDYQARRLRIKYGKKDSPAKGLVHTQNNTAIATARTIVGILENFQNKDGSVSVPRALRPYMNGMKKIERGS